MSFSAVFYGLTSPPRISHSASSMFIPQCVLTCGGLVSMVRTDTGTCYGLTPFP
jgi:hypothetical protein